MAGATVLRVALLNLSIYQSTNCEICAIIPHRYFNLKKKEDYDQKQTDQNLII